MTKPPSYPTHSFDPTDIFCPVNKLNALKMIVLTVSIPLLQIFMLIAKTFCCTVSILKYV